MQIIDIKHAQCVNVELRVLKDTNIRENIPITITQQNNYILVTPVNRREPPILVEPVDKKNQEKLQNALKRNLPRLCQLINKTYENTIIVTMQIFPAEKPIDMVIGIEDKFIKNVKNKINITRRNPEVGLTELFLISINQVQYAVMGIHTHVNQRNSMDSFLFVGKGGYLQINRKKDEQGNIYFTVNKVMSRIKKEDYVFYLIKGNIQFTNATIAEKAKLETLVFMNELGGTIESYLNTWQTYGDLEQKYAFDSLQEAGMIHYKGCHFTPNGSVRLDLEEGESLRNIAEVVSKGTYISISSEKPSLLFQNKLTLETYENISKELDIRSFVLTEDVSANAQSIYIKTPSEDQDIPQEGYIFLSLSGQVSQFKRREKARDAILSAQSPMPHLAAILEGVSVSVPQKNSFEPITETVRKKVFPKHPPTPKQKEAIEVALNTPDIALIQGPPGTGKTTVILGILERLNEIYDSSDGIFGKNLVSAFQHDAVQNAVDRIEILGLPAIKFGRKSNETDEEVQLIEHRVENWISNKLQELYKAYPDLAKEKYFEDFQNIYKNYLYSANTIENTIKLLHETKELLVTKLNVALLNEIDETISDLKYSLGKISDPTREQIIKSVSKIPYTKVAFEDNGMDSIMEAIFRLKKEDKDKFKDEINQLQRFLTIEQWEQKHFDSLKKLRKQLLITLIPKPNLFNSRKQKEGILQLFNKISEYLQNEFYKSKSGEDAVLFEYISQYENSPLSIRETILDYISVLGATNQQAMGSAIAKVKGSDSPYDNVLVDEAARSNPLDLFIPMSLAKDRIILVGDHRQLPHIVDEHIVKGMDNEYKDEVGSIKDKVNKNLKDSLFERLFEKLKELEKKDGIRRTVTLDKQYRTHKVLGDFISDNFYSKHKGEVEIGSGLPNSAFTHELPGLKDKACVWMDLPMKMEREISGASKSRPFEARKIVEHLKKMMDSEPGKEMSFGIITFYKKQVDTIMKELVKAGIAVKDENHHYEILPPYRETVVNGKIIERLRVGTVDAFQGMEFDVVYLSMVRSNDLPDHTEKEKQKKYGFLMVENRLCVSMSRQKKMLIVAGDSGMLHTKGAKEAIEPLVNYYKLCQGDEVYGKII